MKYIFLPIYRVLFALFIGVSQIILLTSWFLSLLWHFRLPREITIKDFWYPISDKYDGIREVYSERYYKENGIPPRSYYKTPWHALIDRRYINPY